MITDSYSLTLDSKGSDANWLDSLEWASCTAYNILGLRVRVRVNQSEFASQVARLMRWFPAFPCGEYAPDTTFSLVVAQPSDTLTARRFHFVYTDGVQLGQSMEQWHLFRWLECQLDHMLAEKIESPLLLHAGAVSKSGMAVLIPGSSGAGKSSLTLSLLCNGYDYLSDEIGVISPASNSLIPFPKPVTIKNRAIFPQLVQRKDLWFGPDSQNPGAVWYLHPGDLGIKVPGEPVCLRYIIFPDRTHSGPARLLPLDPAEAFKELVSNAINLPALGSSGFRSMANLVRESRCFKLQSSDLKDSVSLVNQLVGATE